MTLCVSLQAGSILSLWAAGCHRIPQPSGSKHTPPTTRFFLSRLSGGSGGEAFQNHVTCSGSFWSPSRGGIDIPPPSDGSHMLQDFVGQIRSGREGGSASCGFFRFPFFPSPVSPEGMVINRVQLPRKEGGNKTRFWCR